MPIKDEVKRKEYHKKYYEDNKSKIINRSRKFYKDYKDEISEKKKKYYIDNRDYILEKSKLYYKNNKQIVRYKFNTYRRNNVKKFTILNQKRRNQNKQLINDFTLEDWENVKREFDYCCAYCGEEVDLQQDHFIPLSKGGNYTPKNIIPACVNCNCSKHAKMFDEWYPKQSFYDKNRELYILNWIHSFEKENYNETI